MKKFRMMYTLFAATLVCSRLIGALNSVPEDICSTSLPAGHVRQPEVPVASWYVPSSQFVHVLAMAWLNVPAKHVVLALFEHLDPAGQGTHWYSASR
jgi:hypothetical protein